MNIKQILPMLAVLLIAGFVMASTVVYLSNQASAIMDVQSPIDNTIIGASIEGEVVDATAPMTFYNGETLVLEGTLDNKSRVTQEGQVVVVITPALEVTAEANVVVGEEYTTVTFPAITVPTDDALTEEVDESIVEYDASMTVANNEPAEYTITSVFNIADVE